MGNTAIKPSIFRDKEKKSDIFDRLREKDIFDRVELPVEEKLKLDPEFQRMIDKAVQKAVDAIKASMVPPAPQKEIVREIRVEVPSKDKRDLVERKELEEARKEIAALKKELAETDERARNPVILHTPGGSGVIGIPDPSQATDGHVLTIESGSDGKRARFKAATGGSGLSGYTVNNGSELKTFDVTDTSLDELARVIGSIISDLQA
jgi:hypothetical protein